MNSLKIKKNDKVVVLSGKDKGKSGKVLGTVPSERKVVVEGINVVTCHIKPRKQGEGAVARKKAEAAKRAEEIIENAREQARANEEKAQRAAEERKREVLAAAETHRADAIKAVMETVI